MAYIVSEYGTTLGCSKVKQRLIIYPALPCIIEMDDVVTRCTSASRKPNQICSSSSSLIDSPLIDVVRSHAGSLLPLNADAISPRPIFFRVLMHFLFNVVLMIMIVTQRIVDLSQR